MPRKFKCESIEGQLSLWDIGITENKGSFTKSEVNIPKTDDKITKIEEKVTKVLINAQIVQNENPIDKLKITPEQQEFLNKNKVMENENLSRLIKQCCGYLAIEMAYENSYVTTYINTLGIKEFDSPKKVQVIPMDKILYYKSLNFKANNTQEEKLLKIKDKALKVIRRKGDENIIIITEKNVISINSIGWVLEWNGIGVIYDEDEVEKNEILQDNAYAEAYDLHKQALAQYDRWSTIFFEVRKAEVGNKKNPALKDRIEQILRVLNNIYTSSRMVWNKAADDLNQGKY